MITFMNLVLFAIVVACMRVVSDYFLVRKGVLVFPDGDKVIFLKALIKMICFRTLALILLGIFYYFYEQLGASYNIPFEAYTFPTLVFMLYVATEFIANNHLSGKLWKEDNCQKILGVGWYVLPAELLETLVLHTAFIMMYLLESTALFALNIGIVTGIVIILSFVLSYEAFGKGQRI